MTSSSLSMLRLSALLLGLASFASCGLFKSVKDVNDTLGDAIKMIEAQSESWQEVLLSTREQLLNEGRQDLVADLDQILGRATATVGVELRCNVDFAGDKLQSFVGHQVAEALQNLRLTDQNQPVIEAYNLPKTCNVSPEGTIVGDRIRDGDVVDIVWYGYDFYQISPDDARFSVVLRDQGTGAEVDISARLALSSHYQMSLALPGLDAMLETDHLYQIVVRWDGDTFSQINVSPATPEPLQLPDCYWGASFSEEAGAMGTCSSGYVMAGLRCAGANCDNLTMQCCPYMDGNDPSATVILPMMPPGVSEEQPDGLTYASGFVSKLMCFGGRCDNIAMEFIMTPKLRNTKQCHFIEWVSEEAPGERSCPDGSYVSGLKCRGQDCDDVSLYCCGGEIL